MYSLNYVCHSSAGTRYCVARPAKPHLQADVGEEEADAGGRREHDASGDELDDLAAHAQQCERDEDQPWGSNTAVHSVSYMTLGGTIWMILPHMSAVQAR